VIALVALGCGGGKKESGEPGEAHAGGPTAGDGTGAAGGVASDGGPIEAGPDAGPPPPPAAVTFVLKNGGAEELALNLDRGWGGVLQAWAGTRGKDARAILMYPSFCTASCDAPETDRCPVCTQPEKVADIRLAQKLERIAPGASLEVPWDGNVYGNEKTRFKLEGKTKRCKCWRAVPVEPATYTVRACGLRLTTTVEQSSRLDCAEGQMTVPADGPIRVELDIVDAPPPTPKRKK
jgi:hypothetical protein